MKKYNEEFMAKLEDLPLIEDVLTDIMIDQEISEKKKGVIYAD
jgi:hypothetical protein